MNHSDFYQILDLPTPPYDLITECKINVSNAFFVAHETGRIINKKNLEVKWATSNEKREKWVFENVDKSSLATQVTSSSGTVLQLAKYKNLEGSVNLVQWVKNNIMPFSDESIICGIQIFHPITVTSIPMGFPAHVDGPRGRRVINLHLNTGGPAAETLWFREPGRSIYRYRPDEQHTYVDGPNLNVLPTAIYDLSCLEILARTQFQPMSWSAIDVKTLHAVQDLITWRFSISVGIGDNQVDEFCKLHNIDPDSGQLWQKLK
jgi:hypothetical protein